MDIDPSPVTAEALLESISETSPVICLPYCLVPSMDIISQSYQRAIITLSKQKINLASTTLQVPLILVLDQGMMPVPSPIHLPNSVYFLTDVVLNTAQGLDVSVTDRAHCIINSAVLQQLEQENTHRTGIYECHVPTHCLPSSTSPHQSFHS